MYNVCVMLVSNENLEPASRLLSLIANPSVPPIQQFSVGLIPASATFDPENDDPYELITHWITAYSDISDEKLALFQSLATTAPTPPEGWPWAVGGVTYLTEAQALEAASFIQLYPGSSEEPDTALAPSLLAQLKLDHNLKGLDV